ncbi:hypothetical protein EV177_009834, partial [Coemansia sp. RSA 1804]
MPSAAAQLPPQPPLQQQPPVAGFVAPVVKKRTPPTHLGLHNAVGTAAMPHPPPAHYQMQHQLLSPYPYSAPIAGVFPPALTGPIPAGPGDTITTTAPMSPAGFWVQSPAQNIAPMPSPSPSVTKHAHHRTSKHNRPSQRLMPQFNHIYQQQQQQQQQPQLNYIFPPHVQNQFLQQCQSAPISPTSVPNNNHVTDTPPL